MVDSITLFHYHRLQTYEEQWQTYLGLLLLVSLLKFSSYFLLLHRFSLGPFKETLLIFRLFAKVLELNLLDTCYLPFPVLGC